MSTTSSSSKSAISGASTAQRRAAAKVADLQRQQNNLKKKQALDEAELKLKQDREELQLAMELERAKIEEEYADVYSDAKDDVEKENQIHVDVASVSSELRQQNVKQWVETQPTSVLNPQASEWIGPQHQLLEALQLPKADMMNFDGDPLQYWVFIRSFDNLVGATSVSDSAKLTRLLQYCTGPAESLIRCCAAMDPVSGYTRARELLHDRFGNEYAIVESWTKRISTGSVLHTSIEIQHFADDLRNCVETLTAINCIAEINQQTLVKIVARLPMHLQHRWRREVMKIRSRNVIPSVSDILKFVEEAAKEANDPVFGQPQSRATEPGQQSRKPQRKAGSFGTEASKLECPKCKKEHRLDKCYQFKSLSAMERFEFASNNQLCFNCLIPGHSAYRCRRDKMCDMKDCKRKHSSLLHTDNVSTVTSTERDDQQTANSGERANNYATGAGTAVVLPIVPVMVRGETGSVKTYALLDSGSTNTFCAETLVEKLGLRPKHKEQLSLTTLHDSDSIVETSVVELNVSGVNGKNEIRLPHVYTRKSLAISPQSMPSFSEVTEWSHLRGLSIPTYSKETKVELLIGQDNPEALAPIQVVKGGVGDPYAVKTALGWTLNGPVGRKGKGKNVVGYVHCSLERQVQRFWEIEDEGLCLQEKGMSVQDKYVMSQYESSISKVKNNHYQVNIPFKQSPVKLQNNKVMAEHRLQSLGRRLRKDSTVQEQYKAGMQQLLEKGCAEKVTKENLEDVNNATWYIPHHPVLNDNKPGKCRIVFDCAAKYRGVSLNDKVFQGPDLTNKLTGVLLRFRQQPIAVMGDIEQMFYQVYVPESDRDALRFLWWPEGKMELPPEEYRMTVHLFGGTWSPSCCNFALRRTVEDNKEDFDEMVKETVLNNFYVDDCLRAVQTEDQAVELIQQLSSLLLKGGFRITKWVSNSRKVIETVPEENRAKGIKALDLGHASLPRERALGVMWDTELDSFTYQTCRKNGPATRRGVLSGVSSVYDPLGFICPFVLPARILLQDLTRRKLNWDERISVEEEERWSNWQDGLQGLRDITIDRCLLPKEFGEVARTELHHFSDASMEAYGAVSYLRFISKDRQIHCALVCAKSRVAPLKTLTVPRLELAAAVTSVKLNSMLKRELTLAIDSTIFWTDSMIVLNYIMNEEKRFHTFVANRVAMIREGSDPQDWRHVDTRQNPADDLSRGLKVNEMLPGSRWVKGPSFLYVHEDEWPTQPHLKATLHDDPEVKKVQSSYATEVNAPSEENVMDKLIQRYSSWYKLKRSIAWLLRYKEFLRRKMKKTSDGTSTTSGPYGLNLDELNQAEIAIIKYVQNEHLEDEIKAVKVNQPVKKSSPLQALTPILSEQGVLCVGGRVQQHPMIIPKRHYIASLVVQQYHQASGHSGREHVLSLVRERFWILQGRAVVRKTLSGCFECKRKHSSPLMQIMADLPADRITGDKPPFTYVGIDCFGPFMVKQRRSQVKRYGCIFTCLTTRAIHVEVLHSLDTSSFINGFHRFTARRGRPEEVRSDNGTNLKGGEREMREAIEAWNQQVIHDTLLQMNIKWTFNTPTASHHGGVWERQIRSIRKVLASLIQEQVLDEEGLCTLLCVTEGIINSRPLTTVSTDPKDPEPLTPNHLLLQRPGPALPPGEFMEDDNCYRRRWRQIQYLANVFWKRWLREYIPILQSRQKWTRPVRNLQVDDVVLVVDEKVRNQWEIGVVREVYPGADGRVRSAQVKTKTTTLKRPIQKLCLLETVSNET